MASQEELVRRTHISELSIQLPFLGKIWLIGGHSPEKQIKQARKRLAKEPNNVRRRLGLALLLTEAGQNKEAVLEWTKAHLELPFDDDVRDDHALSQENAYAHYTFGIILHNTGAVKEAIQEWNRASEMDQYGIGQLAREKMEAAKNLGASD